MAWINALRKDLQMQLEIHELDTAGTVEKLRQHIKDKPELQQQPGKSSIQLQIPGHQGEFRTPSTSSTYETSWPTNQMEKNRPID